MNQIVKREQEKQEIEVAGGGGRQVLMEIMAEQLDIPAYEAQRTDVVAVLATALENSLKYGFTPGVHTHVQKFETRESKDARDKNPSIPPEYTYTFVIGEKAWKESGARWRERGVRWYYQRKPMTKDEVKEEARLMDIPEKELARNSYGMWSRIIVDGEDDPDNPDTPMWSAGVYVGKARAGSYLRNDVLPAGNSSRDVAIRRADKRAMMQSRLTLLPLDDFDEGERVARLLAAFQSHQAQIEMDTAYIKPRPRLLEDDHGDLVYVDPSPMGDGPGGSDSMLTTPRGDTERSAKGGGKDWGDSGEDAEDDFDPFSQIIHHPDIKLPESASTLILQIRKHEDGSKPMDAESFAGLKKLLDARYETYENPAMTQAVLSCIYGRKVDEDNPPGVTGVWLATFLEHPGKHEEKSDALDQIAAVCQMVFDDLLA